MQNPGGAPYAGDTTGGKMSLAGIQGKGFGDLMNQGVLAPMPVGLNRTAMAATGWRIQPEDDRTYRENIAAELPFFSQSDSEFLKSIS